MRLAFTLDVGSHQCHWAHMTAQRGCHTRTSHKAATQGRHTSATGHTGLHRDAATQERHVETGIVTASPGFTETEQVKMRRQRNLFKVEEQEKKKNTLIKQLMKQK